ALHGRHFDIREGLLDAFDPDSVERVEKLAARLKSHGDEARVSEAEQRRGDDIGRLPTIRPGLPPQCRLVALRCGRRLRWMSLEAMSPDRRNHARRQDRRY